MLSKPAQDASAHRVLLTLDDGPHPGDTVFLLDELARRGLSAVFFVLGERLESPANHAILERVAGDGHFIGVHGYSHQLSTHLTDDQIRGEVRRTEALIAELDRGVKLWRPPFGDHDHRVDYVVASLGYTRMMWNVDSLDWVNPAPVVSWVDHTFERIRLRQARGFRNTVCLLHDAFAASRLENFLDRLGEIPDTRIARYNPWHVDPLCLSKHGREPSTSPICPSDAVGFHLGDARVVARAQINTLYVLNESAGLVWYALAAGSSPAEAAQTLASQYDISEDLAWQDVQSTMANWRSDGLIGPKAVESEIPGPWVRSTKEVRIVGGGQFEEEHAYRFLDLRFRIRCQTADLARAIHPRFANLEAPGSAAPKNRDADCAWMAPESIFQVAATGGDYVLGLADAVATSHSSPAALAYELFFEIMNLAYPDLSLMACLHSSLIEWGDGAVALVGNNGSGKSTLAAALVSSGRSALGDDRLFLDSATGRPVATPNAIGLKRGSWLPLLSRYPNLLQLPLVRNQLARNQEEEVRFLPPPPPTERLLPPVKYVFFPRYGAAPTTAASPLTCVEALERITAAEGWISADPEKLSRFLQWMEGVRCYDLPYCALDAAIEQMEEYLRAGAGA
jgi:peptidoglycan/xylan/chitin deacetylase (PgdA/CDA1 family)